MAQLTKDTPRVFELAGGNDFNDLQASNVIIYEGSAVSATSGYARQLNVADTNFLGFCEKYVDNSAGSAGDKNVRVRHKGYVKLSVTGASAVTDRDAAVYASDGNTFTKTSTGNVQIGKIHRWVSGTTCIVYFEAVSVRSI